MESLFFHLFDKAVIFYPIMSVKMMEASSGPIAPHFLQPGRSREWKGRTVYRLMLGKGPTD